MLISFSIGSYHDEVMCDVVPMQASHILLGRPWQFDRRVKYDGYKNQYSFVFNKRNVILTPQKPWEASEDQVRIAREFKEKHLSVREESGKKERVRVQQRVKNKH